MQRHGPDRALRKDKPRTVSSLYRRLAIQPLEGRALLAVAMAAELAPAALSAGGGHGAFDVAPFVSQQTPSAPSTAHACLPPGDSSPPDADVPLGGPLGPLPLEPAEPADGIGDAVSPVVDQEPVEDHEPAPGAADELLPGQVSGTVFLDYNASGAQDPPEPGLPGRMVYLDLSHNGASDAGEPAAVTGPDGSYRFQGLHPGSAMVRQQHTPDHGVIITAPEGGGHQLVLASGASVEGRDAGNVLISQVSPIEVAAHRFPALDDAQTAAIHGIYRNLLGREADEAGAAHWREQLAAGASREDVAGGIWRSAEHRGYQVDRYYSTLFQRPADAEGRSWWVDAFLVGADERQVVAGMLASDEYQLERADEAAFVAEVFRDVLSRPADGESLAWWTREMHQGAPREQVAQRIAASPEADLRAVDGYYAAFLHRAGESQGRGFWLDSLQAGQLSLAGVGARFLGDPTFEEYFAAAELAAVS